MQPRMLFLAVLCGILGSAGAAEETFEVGVGPSTQGLGQLLIKDAQSGSGQRLNIARYRVNVVLQPPVALVQIDQSFYNPYSRQEEGTFVFNLPARRRSAALQCTSRRSS